MLRRIPFPKIGSDPSLCNSEAISEPTLHPATHQSPVETLSEVKYWKGILKRGGSIEPSFSVVLKKTLSLGFYRTFRGRKGGSMEPFGGFDRTFLGWSPISGYRFKTPSISLFECPQMWVWPLPRQSGPPSPEAWQKEPREWEEEGVKTTGDKLSNRCHLQLLPMLARDFVKFLTLSAALVIFQAPKFRVFGRGV